MQIVGVVANLQAHEFGSLHESVHTDGEILATHIDVSSVEEWQHTLRLQFLQVLVVSKLHFMAEFNHLREIVGIVESVLYGVLYATVEVDGEHALRAGRHTARTERIAEAVVLNLVAQTAARAERVGIVAHVCEERVTLRVHLRREVAPLFVYHVAVLCEQCHCLYGESQHRLCTLVVEPLHEAFLQP